jgi:hypothetical protein
MFTAAAALISAVTGLVVVVQQLWPEHSPDSKTVSMSAAGGAITTDTLTSTPSRTQGGRLSVRFPAGTHAEVGEAAYDVAGSDVTVGNPGQLTLALRVRMTNNGRYPANFWSRSFRLRVGSDTGAPSNVLDNLVAPGTTDTAEVDFRVDALTRDATLFVGDDVAKAVSLPVTITR